MVARVQGRKKMPRNKIFRRLFWLWLKILIDRINVFWRLKRTYLYFQPDLQKRVGVLEVSQASFTCSLKRAARERRKLITFFYREPDPPPPTLYSTLQRRIVQCFLKSYTQQTRSAHTLLGTVHDLFKFICWYKQKHRREALTFAAVHLSLFFWGGGAFEAVSQNGYGNISTTYFFIKYLPLMMEQLISLDRSGTNHLIM